MGVPHGNRGSKHAAKRVRNPDTQRSPHNNSHIKDNKRSRGITKNDTINRGDGDTRYHVEDSLTPAGRYIYARAKRKQEEKAVFKRQNLICNFRAPDHEYYQVWRDFTKSVHEQGLDVCYVVLSLTQTWLKAVEAGEAACQFKTATKIINIQQQNTFLYNVKKPRREPVKLGDKVKTAFSRHISSMMVQAYIMEKARDLKRSFSFRDFCELDYNSFRKSILKLKQREKIIALEPRSNPRYYILREWKPLYASMPIMKENNRVKPWFTVRESGDLRLGGL